MPDEERPLRIKEAAAFPRLSHKTVRRMIAAGPLQCRELRGIRLIRYSDQQRLIQEA
jgi:hypothetical protein